MKRAFVIALLACACRSGAKTKADATTSAPDLSATLPALPLDDFAITFRETSMVAGGTYLLEIKRDKTLVCDHGGTSATTTVSDFELAPLESIVRTREFRDAAKPTRYETGDTPSYDIHVTSKAVNIDAKGYVLTASDYTTPAPMKTAIAELEKLCALPKTSAVGTFTVVYTRTEQGGTAGSQEIDEVRSDGTTERRDAFRVLQTGKADVADLAPLSRLLARPELAALGASFHDGPSTPPMPETDYDIEILKTTKLSGIFHDKTPPIILAITGEVNRVARTSKPR